MFSVANETDSAINTVAIGAPARLPARRGGGQGRLEDARRPAHGHLGRLSHRTGQLATFTLNVLAPRTEERAMFSVLASQAKGRTVTYQSAVNACARPRRRQDGAPARDRRADRGFDRRARGAVGRAVLALGCGSGREPSSDVDQPQGRESTSCVSCRSTVQPPTTYSRPATANTDSAWRSTRGGCAEPPAAAVPDRVGASPRSRGSGRAARRRRAAPSVGEASGRRASGRRTPTPTGAARSPRRPPIAQIAPSWTTAANACWARGSGGSRDQRSRRGS